MVNLIAFHCIVIGRVQGVWYRATTQKQARNLGLTGWVRNQDDGSVEVFITGPEEQVNKLCEWLWIGPSGARVDDVRITTKPYEQHDDFVVL